MAEEVIIKVATQGADQAERELQRVVQAASQADRDYNKGLSQSAASALQGAGAGDENEARRLAREREAERDRQERQALNDMRSEALAHRASGNIKDADELDHEAKIVERSRQLRQGTGISRDDADAAARTQVEHEAKISSNNAAETQAAMEAREQERLNDRLVKEEAARQGKEAKEAAAQERKAKADQLRAERSEHGRSWTEDRMQEQLNEQLVKDEEKRQRQEAVEKAKTGAMQNTRQSFLGNLDVMELRAGGNDKEADALERTNRIRERARDLARDLNVHQDRAVELATREYDAREKLNGSGGGGGRAAGAALGMFDSATGGIPMGAIFSTLSNPLALAGMAVGAIGGKLLSDRIAAHDSIAREEGASAAEANRRQQIASGTFGDGDIERQQEAAARRKANKKALDDANAAKGSFRNKGFIDMELDSMNVIMESAGRKTHFETSGEKAARENEDKRARLERDLPADAAQAFETAKAGLPWLRIKEQMETLAGNRRGARDTENEIARRITHDRVLEEFGGREAPGAEAIAKEAGDREVQLRVREENMKWAHLVNASSSRSDIARAVALATGQIHGGGHHDPAVSAVDELVRMNRDHHNEGRLQRFVPRSLRHQQGGQS